MCSFHEEILVTRQLSLKFDIWYTGQLWIFITESHGWYGTLLVEIWVESLLGELLIVGEGPEGGTGPFGSMVNKGLKALFPITSDGRRSNCNLWCTGPLICLLSSWSSCCLGLISIDRALDWAGKGRTPKDGEIMQRNIASDAIRNLYSQVEESDLERPPMIFVSTQRFEMRTLPVIDCHG